LFLLPDISKEQLKIIELQDKTAVNIEIYHVLLFHISAIIINFIHIYIAIAGKLC